MYLSALSPNMIHVLILPFKLHQSCKGHMATFPGFTGGGKP